MIKVMIIPRAGENVYALLVRKERELRENRKGTLHRTGRKRKDFEKWTHTSYPGSIRLQNCLEGIAAAAIQCKKPNEEWQLMKSFVGFLDRHFRGNISSIFINYGDSKNA